MNGDLLFTDNEQFLVVLDSRNCTQYLNDSFNSKLFFDFEEPIYMPYDALKMTCSVLSFTCPNSLYNLNENTSYLHLEYTNLEKTDIFINLTYGNYDANSFITALKLAIYNQDKTFHTGFEIVLNETTNKFTLGHSTYSFSIMYDSSMYNILGFEKNVTHITGSTLPNSPYLYTLYSPFMCNFNGTQNINIHIENILTSNLDSHNNSFSSIICSIPIDNNQSQISYIKNNDFCITIKDNVIDILKISFRDDLDNYVNFNNQHWNLTLCFALKRDISRFSHMQSFRNILSTNIF